ncbi:uncharacterized protein TNCV_1775571 [Trichonephila clavipes]|nr:uncharacterized protein TNCV_1775571 [Trichonephila clavipes]
MCQIRYKILQSIDHNITKKRSCSLQWIPAHINILGDEKADKLAKESRACPQSFNLTTLIDTNATASPTENSLAVLNHKISEANSQVRNVKLGGHQTCLSINRLWHELCDILRRLVGTTAPGHHDCSIQE